MSSKIAATEDAIIATSLAVLQNRVKTVEWAPPDWDKDFLTRAMRALPGVFVIFEGGLANEGGGQSVRLNSRWCLVAITQNKQGDKARARGDATEIGCYEMLEVLIPALDGLVVEVGNTNEPVGTLNFLAWDNDAAIKLEDSSLMVQSASFALDLDLSKLPDDSLLRPFQTFHGTFDVGQLAGAPDMDNHVELEQ